MDARRFMKRYSDPVIAGPDGYAGRIGTYDVNLIRAGYALDVSRISKSRRERALPRPGPVRRPRKPQDSFRIGATRGNFDMATVIGLAVVVAGAYVLIKK